MQIPVTHKTQQWEDAHKLLKCFQKLNRLNKLQIISLALKGETNQNEFYEYLSYNSTYIRLIESN